MQTVQTDLIILGGGIAGLWLLNRVRQAGYDALLLECGNLGGGQSIRSQGIIHGGTKYALNGVLTQASNTIANMPQRWRDCLNGSGELDLTATKVLSDAHYMWSKGSLGSKMTTFFASKALKGRVDSIAEQDRPRVFKDKGFRGSLYKLNELVLDTPSLIHTLAKPHQDRIFLNSKDNTRINTDNQGQIQSIELTDRKISIQAQRYILTAGEGTQALLDSWKINEPQMQRRPLHMVVVRHGADLPTFAHCISTGSKPVVTITTHPAGENEQAWYLGGDLAETGVNRSPEQQIAEAKKTLQQLLPWIELPNARWASFRIERAEPQQSSLTRPDSAFAQAVHNGIIAWPTKLALSPDLADQILQQLEQQAVVPKYIADLQRLTDLPHPEIAQPAWESLF